MTEHSAPPPRRPPPTFRPRFTISILYLAGFFVLFSFLQVLPDLIALLSEMEPGPAQQEAAEAITREGADVRISLVLSVAATALGTYLKILPGMRVDT